MLKVSNTILNTVEGGQTLSTCLATQTLKHLAFTSF